MPCRYIHKAVVERPKMGFSVPIGMWLHGPRGWAEDLFNESRFRLDGYSSLARSR